MMKKLVVVALLGAIGAAGTARAEFVNAPQLADWLAEARKAGGSFKDRTLALGYVSGVHDAFERTEICTPDGTSAKSLLSTVEDWMRAHPDEWGRNGADTVRRALAARWPCAEPAR